VDVDGNEYVDCVNGFGPVFLGHGHPVVVDALVEAVSRGTTFGTPHPDEVRLAEILVEGIPCAGKVTFTNTGSQATDAALRVARVLTGKPGVAKFEGGFHGGYDAVLGSFAFDPEQSGPVEDPRFVSISNGAPAENLAHTHVLPFNHDAAFDKIERDASKLALVMVEGVQGFGGGIVADRSWLQELSRVCRANDVLLMLDEVITGFRLGYGGAQEHFDVEVDLATYGKAPGAGLPLGVVAGTDDAMEMLGTTGDFARDLKERAYFGGTYNAGVLVTAVGIAVLEYLKSNQHLYEQIDQLGEMVRTGIGGVIEELGVEAAVIGEGSIWGFQFAPAPIRSVRDIPPGNGRLRSLLQAYLLAEGVFVSPSFGVLSMAHTSDDVERIVTAHHNALAAMKADAVIA
jgi:glutamate-1-semialdehyde 2,1-aminomutase